MGAPLAVGALGQRPLALYLFVRLVVGTLLVLSVPLVKDLPQSLPVFDPKVLLALGLGSMSAWALGAALGPRFGRNPAYLWSQLALDAVLVTILIQASAGPRSALFVLYVVNISAAGILASPNAALIVAGLDTALFLGSSLTVNSLLPTPLWTLDGFELAYELVLRGLALLLIGMLVRLPYERARVERAERSAVLDELSAGVLRVDRGGRILEVNAAARRVLGPCEGRRLRDLLTPEDERWEQPVRVGDEVRHLLCSRSPLVTGGEVVLIEDVTRLRQMEDNLAREERLGAVGRLTAALAHEIRNPLASLSGAVQLVAEEHPDPLYDIMLREVRRINGLVEELLDPARPLSLNVISSDASTILTDVVASMRMDPRFRDRISVQMELDELPQVYLDPGRFKQVVWNLMLNAAQAIPERGSVTVNAAIRGDALLVTVRDTGVGIPVSVQHRLFDPFFTTRVGGTGLGLATVHRIVSAHGGEIGVESQEGAGTTFTLRFPQPAREEQRLVG